MRAARPSIASHIAAAQTKQIADDKSFPENTKNSANIPKTKLANVIIDGIIYLILFITADAKSKKIKCKLQKFLCVQLCSLSKIKQQSL